MASTILIKRSTGTTVPSSLEFGELAVTVGAGTQVNRGDRVFIGDNNTTVQVIGGKYFTDMLDHVHGILTANSGVITDSNSKVNRFRVDDVNIDANVVETDTTDTDLIFRANGTGKLVIEDEQELEFGTTGDIELKFDSASNVLRLDRVGVNTPEFRLDDDLKIQFGSDGDAGIRYDASQLNVVRVDGADWQFDNGVAIQINDVTNATNRTTGSVKIAGGLGVDQTAWIKDLVVDDGVTLGTSNADDLLVNSTTVFKNGVTFEGTVTNSNVTVNQTGQFNIDNLRLDGNTISTTSGSVIILDPDPSSGDAAGDLIVRGNLQVAGTTTTVNSTQMTVNDPIFNIGDTTSQKVVKADAPSGTTTVNIDNPSGINTGSLVNGANIGSGGRTISSIEVVFHVASGFSSAPSVGNPIYFYNGTSYQQIGTYQTQSSNTLRITVLSTLSLRESSYYESGFLTDDNTGTPQSVALVKDATDKTVFETTTLNLNSPTSGALSIGEFLDILQGSNDGMDRGIQYSYHDGSGIRHGFFGYDRTGGEDGTGAFTFIENAVNTNNIFTHLVGGISAVSIEKNDLNYDSGTIILAAAGQSYVGLIPSGGSGNGVTFNISRDGAGAIDSIVIDSPGNYYQEGDLLTIPGNAIGGVAGTDNLLLRVTSIISTRGTVVIGDLELDNDLAVKFGGTGRSEFNTYGILYGNGTGELKETAAANMANPGVGPDVATSYQILTVTAAGIPVWTDTVDGGTFT